jgi:hypothetical protein
MVEKLAFPVFKLDHLYIVGIDVCVFFLIIGGRFGGVAKMVIIRRTI